jgi:hypothetical protein
MIIVMINNTNNNPYFSSTNNFKILTSIAQIMATI